MKSKTLTHACINAAAVLLTALPVHAQNLDEALRAVNEGRHAQALQLLTPLANANNAYAQLRLGMLHYYGQGTREDEQLAIHWWSKAAAQGNAEAMFQIANAYLFGSQVSRSVVDPDREAAIWYFQAASAGHAEAQYHLGLLFLAGKGVVDSHEEAARWFRKAADQGHVEAKKAIGNIEEARKSISSIQKKKR